MSGKLGSGNPYLEVVANAHLQTMRTHRQVVLSQVNLGHEQVRIHRGRVQFQAALQGALGILKLS